MSDRSIVIRIKAIIKACEEAKKNMIPTFYETAEATAYEHILDLLVDEEGETE